MSSLRVCVRSPFGRPLGGVYLSWSECPKLSVTSMRHLVTMDCAHDAGIGDGSPSLFCSASKVKVNDRSPELVFVHFSFFPFVPPGVVFRASLSSLSCSAVDPTSYPLSLLVFLIHENQRDAGLLEIWKFCFTRETVFCRIRKLLPSTPGDLTLAHVLSVLIPHDFENIDLKFAAGQSAGFRGTNVIFFWCNPSGTGAFFAVPRE